MIQKVLVADRGEIALRIVRACKELGLPTVAIHSEADTHSLHVGYADEDVCIGPPASDQSYRNIPRILSAADVTGADAIHPGYGPLAENAEFAEICASCGITFIGPPPDAIRRMGDKAVARETMMKAGVPVTPGTLALKTMEGGREAASKIGYPVRLKAIAGGGGRGMRTVRTEAEFEKSWQMAHAEAEAAFTSGALYLEKEIEKPRHVEIQILADKQGRVLQLGERECSVQRRSQKLVEESPSPAVTPEIREAMGQAAVRGAAEVGYENAGTMEFLLDDDGSFYFMEMNKRIQVEHPITEMVTGIDLVKAQIQIAGGAPLPYDQSDVTFTGHAIECRLNAEDPDKGFRPSPGTVTAFHIPGGPGIRVDSHVYTGYVIPSQYDSLLAKLIAYGRTREEAIARMRRALDEFVVEGVPTTIPFHQKAMVHEDFVRGQITTDFVRQLGYET